MNKYNSKIHTRKSIRLKGYDYSQAGLYFITICCQNRVCLFGEIVGDEMVLNDVRRMIEKIWNDIPVYYNKFNIHQFIVMPSHVHGIIEIVGVGPRAYYPDITEQPQGVAPMGLGDIVHRYKTLATKKYIDGVKHNG